MSDGLTYSEIIAEATREAASRGLLVSAGERDESLFVTLTSTRPAGDASARREATFWTSGTGAFLLDLDQRWSWQDFGYDRDDQVVAVRTLVRVVQRYLSDVEQETRGTGRRGRLAIVMDVDGEHVVLEERDRRTR